MSKSSVKELAWPDPLCHGTVVSSRPVISREWWWMRFRRSSKSKWLVVLVKLVERDGLPFVKAFQTGDWLSPKVCRWMEARFVPAVPPPEEWQ